MPHITRPSDVFPENILTEYRRLAALDQPVIRYLPLPDSNGFYAELAVKTWISRFCRIGSDVFGAAASIAWIREGPKIAHVTEKQYQAMANVDIRLELHDFSSPYPTVLVSLPPGHLHRACLVHRFNQDVLVLQQISYDNKNDICTVVRHCDGTFMESSLETYDPSLSEVAQESSCTLRVSCNMLLAMASYQSYSQYLFPAEVLRDQAFVAKGDRPGRSGRTASDRLREAPILVSLDRSVSLHRCDPGAGNESSSTSQEKVGREMPFHWRRGTWVMQPHGPGGSQRKRIFRRPTMVRADRLTAAPADTTTSYH